jgi:Spy/CpxP family protein refolding chaperone
MKIKVGLLMVAVAGYLLSTSVVYAQEVKGAENKGNPVGIQQDDKLFDQLNLTPEQKQKLKANKQAQVQEMQAVRTSLREKHKSLQEALKNPSVTRASVLGIVNEIKELQAKQVDLRLDGIFSVKDILTPAQYVKFQQLMEEKLNKMVKPAGKRPDHRAKN